MRERGIEQRLESVCLSDEPYGSIDQDVQVLRAFLSVSRYQLLQGFEVDVREVVGDPYRDVHRIFAFDRGVRDDAGEAGRFSAFLAPAVDVDTAVRVRRRVEPAPGREIGFAAVRRGPDERDIVRCRPRIDQRSGFGVTVAHVEPIGPGAFAVRLRLEIDPRGIGSRDHVVAAPPLNGGSARTAPFNAPDEAHARSDVQPAARFRAVGHDADHFRRAAADVLQLLRFRVEDEDVSTIRRHVPFPRFFFVRAQDFLALILIEAHEGARVRKAEDLRLLSIEEEPREVRRRVSDFVDQAAFADLLGGGRRKASRLPSRGGALGQEDRLTAVVAAWGASRHAPEGFVSVRRYARFELPRNEDILVALVRIVDQLVAAPRRLHFGCGAGGETLFCALRRRCRFTGVFDDEAVQVGRGRFEAREVLGDDDLVPGFASVFAFGRGFATCVLAAFDGLPGFAAISAVFEAVGERFALRVDATVEAGAVGKPWSGESREHLVRNDRSGGEAVDPRRRGAMAVRRNEPDAVFFAWQEACEVVTDGDERAGGMSDGLGPLARPASRAALLAFDMPVGGIALRIDFGLGGGRRRADWAGRLDRHDRRGRGRGGGEGFDRREGLELARIVDGDEADFVGGVAVQFVGREFNRLGGVVGGQHLGRRRLEQRGLGPGLGARLPLEVGFGGEAFGVDFAFKVGGSDADRRGRFDRDATGDAAAGERAEDGDHRMRV